MRRPLAAVAILLLLAGPSEAVAGKVVRHSEEYLRRHPAPLPALPDPLPESVEALVSLLEAGHETAAVLEALGDALLRSGDRALAFRAYDRASRLGHPDPAHLERKKAATGVLVDRRTIEREEALAREWVEALKAHERAQLEAGRDPNDLATFFERYGRPWDDMLAVRRAVRSSFVAGAAGVLVGLAFAIGCRRVPKWAAAAPLLVAAACYALPSLLGRTGILPWGAGAAAAGGVFALAFGRRR